MTNRERLIFLAVAAIAFAAEILMIYLRGPDILSWLDDVITDITTERPNPITSARGQLRTIQAALESYGFYHAGIYPTEQDGLPKLLTEVRRILNRVPDDPFGMKDGDKYCYATDERFHRDKEGKPIVYHWVCWSRGPRGSCQAFFINGEGTLVVHDGGPLLIIEGIKGTEPGIPSADQIAYSTNATVTHIFTIKGYTVKGRA